MRGLQRDMRRMYVAKCSGKAKVMNGNDWTGEWRETVSEPFTIYASITQGRKSSSETWFGVDVVYERVVTIDHVNTGIDEASMMWINSVPTFDANGLLIRDANGDPAVPADYVVTGTAESLNYTKIAVSKVR